MLRWRFSLGTIFVAALVAMCWLELRLNRPGICLLPLALVVGRLAAGEIVAMFRARGHQPLAGVVYVGTLLVILAASWRAFPTPINEFALTAGAGVFSIVFALCFFMALVAEMRRYGLSDSATGSGNATTNIALTMLAILYVGGLMSFLVELRMVGGNRMGMFALGSMIATVKMSDIGQYTAGRLFGRHKLAPKISPGKTWEGLLGGLLFAIVTAALFFEPAFARNWNEPETILRATIYGASLAIAGVIGDLAESMFKRDAGVKDSSNWMPGFGGVLDLLDSLLGAAPVAYLFWSQGWIGPGG